MSKRVAVLGDNTTTGGKIISASDQSFCAIEGAVCVGDYAYCPKCIGKIIEGTDNFIVAGKPAAYDGCIIACKCSPIGYNKIIATKSTIIVGVKNQNSHFVRMANTFVKNNIHNNLNNKVEKNNQQDVEAYLFTIRKDNFTQLGTHSSASFKIATI
jgi:uncharacterized Zn-binding protein involved in type VI secretion